MKLTNYFLKKKIQDLAEKSSARMHQFCSLDKARNILLVYDMDHREAGQGCEKKLLGMNKTVYTCILNTHAQTSSENTDSSMLVSVANDTDLLEIPKDSVKEQFNQLPADILIDLTQNKHHLMHYLILNHPSMCKVGRKHSHLSMHDMAICVDDEEDIHLLFEHILFYLQTIRSK